MRHTRGAVLLAIALAVPGIVSAAKQPSVAGGVLRFEVHDLDGEVVRSSDPRFEGKVLLVDLWGTWCPPCLTEIPTLNDLHDRLEARGLVIVAVAFEGEEDPEARRAELREFVAKRDIRYLVLDGGSTEEFERAMPNVENVRGFPVEILIGRDGAVAESRNGYGYKKKWARTLEEKLVRLLEPIAPE